MALSWLRRQWREAISVWRKAPVCFSLGGAFSVAWVLFVGLFICCGRWLSYHVLIPVVEQFHPGIDAPDNWALGITYWLYFVMGLCCGSLAFLWAGVWRAHRREQGNAAGRGGGPPDAAAAQAQE